MQRGIRKYQDRRRNREGNDTRSHEVDTVESCGNLIRTDELISSTNLGIIEDEPAQGKEDRKENSEVPRVRLHSGNNGNQSAVFVQNCLVNGRDDVHHRQGHNHNGKVKHRCEDRVQNTQTRTHDDRKGQREGKVLCGIVSKCRNGCTHQRCVTQRHIETALGVNKYCTGSNDGNENTVVDDVAKVAGISGNTLTDKVSSNDQNQHTKRNEVDVELLVGESCLQVKYGLGLKALILQALDGRDHAGDVVEELGVFLVEEDTRELELLDLFVIAVFLLDLCSLANGLKAELDVVKLLGIKVLTIGLGKILVQGLVQLLEIIQMSLFQSDQLLANVLLELVVLLLIT